MRRFEVGDRVRIDIPDTDDPDFDRYHGRTGKVVKVIKDDAGEHNGDDQDSYLFRVAFDDGMTVDIRWRDIGHLWSAPSKDITF